LTDAPQGNPASPRRRLLLGLFHKSDAWTVPDAEVDRLAREFPDVDVRRARSDEELSEALPGAEILSSWALGEARMREAGALRWIHAPAAGVGAYLTPAVVERGVTVTNSRGCHAVPIAEHAMGMMVALARRFRDGVVEQTTTGLTRENWWTGAAIPSEVFGRTLGLFGYGAIGREVARRAVAFGMRVIALKRHPQEPSDWDPALLSALALPAPEPQVDEVLGPPDLDRLLAESDAIVVCAALTPETQSLFGARAFSRMKRGAWFINIARGKIVRQHDLAEAVRSGHLGGAALDVFEAEPLPRDSELYTLPNVILTPHVSGLSNAFWPRMMAVLRENLSRDADGRPLLNRVSIERGY
jgi:phosphoglycerate dehydrogenase-like enzyme